MHGPDGRNHENECVPARSIRRPFHPATLRLLFALAFLLVAAPGCTVMFGMAAAAGQAGQERHSRRGPESLPSLRVGDNIVVGLKRQSQASGKFLGWADSAGGVFRLRTDWGGRDIATDQVQWVRPMKGGAVVPVFVLIGLAVDVWIVTHVRFDLGSD